MKKLTALFFALLFTFLVACQGETGGESPYKKDSALSFMVTYKEGELCFPQAEWGASKEDWLKAMGFTEEDWELRSNDKEYETYTVLPFIWFEDMGCPGRVTVEFFEDQLRRVRLALIGQPEGFELTEADKDAYKPVDLVPSAKKLAEQLEKADLPESESAKAMLPYLYEMEPGTFTSYSASWESGDTTFSVALEVKSSLTPPSSNIIHLTVTSNLGLPFRF